MNNSNDVLERTAVIIDRAASRYRISRATEVAVGVLFLANLTLYLLAVNGLLVPGFYL